MLNGNRHRPGRYDVETEVQEKSGRVKKKLATGKWISRGRYVWQQEHSETLESDQRVFHVDGDRANDDPANLVPIRFGSTVYRLLHSRVVWSPKAMKLRPAPKKLVLA